jgi:hypothetical protein
LGPDPGALCDEEGVGELDLLAELLLPTALGSQHLLALHLRDDDAILAWFDRNYAACMTLVPTRRREQFLAGVYAAVNDGVIDLGG